MKFERFMGGYHSKLSETSSVRVYKNNLNENPWSYTIYNHENGVAIPQTTVNDFKTNKMSMDAVENKLKTT